MIFLNIYTDGACSGNQDEKNFGGFGAILEYGEHRKEIFGGQADTTNNRMEMTALLRAFEAIKKDGQKIRVFADSAYLINCFKKKWYENWRQNGWKTAGKKPVENKDLWELILPYLSRHNIEFYKVKGHINLAGKKTDVGGLFEDFTEANGDFFTVDEFRHIVEMNNNADGLANKGISEVKGESPV